MKMRMLAVVLAFGTTVPVLADDDAKRFEVTFMPAYNSLLGDGGDHFDNGPSASFGFEVAINEPHEKRVFRAFSIRVTGGYAGFDGKTYDAKLDGAVFGLDAVVVANAGKVVKPYGFLGFGMNNLSDDFNIVTGSDGIGFAFGAGSKFFFGDTFMALLELSHQDYTVDGDYDFSPSHLNFVQLRFGFGFRF